MFETGGDRPDRNLLTKGLRTTEDYSKLYPLLNLMSGFVRRTGCGGKKNKSHIFASEKSHDIMNLIQYQVLRIYRKWTFFPELLTFHITAVTSCHKLVA